MAQNKPAKSPKTRKAASKGVGVAPAVDAAENKGGRPTIYTDELADKICERIAKGESLVKIGEDEQYPTDRTIYRWLDVNKGFCQRYARARERQADLYAAEIVELADKSREGVKTRETKDGTFREFGDMVERSRLQIDARKWYASKLAPKKYGDKLELEVDDKRDDSSQRLAELLSRATGRDRKQANS